MNVEWVMVLSALVETMVLFMNIELFTLNLSELLAYPLKTCEFSKKIEFSNRKDPCPQHSTLTAVAAF